MSKDHPMHTKDDCLTHDGKAQDRAESKGPTTVIGNDNGKPTIGKEDTFGEADIKMGPYKNRSSKSSGSTTRSSNSSRPGKYNSDD